MIFPKGISGFFDSDKQLPVQDIKLLKQVSYEIACAHHGQWLSMDASLNGKNFYSAKLLLAHKQCYLLMNAYYPLFAFAASIEQGQVAFMDQPAVASDWSYPYPLLCAAELLAPYAGSIDALAEVELAQIRYWKPTSIGDILYNFWD